MHNYTSTILHVSTPWDISLFTSVNKEMFDGFDVTAYGSRSEKGVTLPAEQYSSLWV